VTSGSSQPPILVGYDPKLRDRAPVRFGVAAARFTGAPLIVVSVCADRRATQKCEELVADAGEALESIKAEVDTEVTVREVRIARLRPAARVPARRRHASRDRGGELPRHRPATRSQGAAPGACRMSAGRSAR
jgi:antitoxin (DNA-binding transcriptional repressor) of toxin-antitoxin stability system